MVGNVACTRTFIIKSAAKIFLTRNTRHLTQVLRQVKTHSRRIFKLFKFYRSFNFPLDRFTIANNRARTKIRDIRTERNDHVHQVGIVLQIHKDAIEALFLEHKRGILGIHGQLKTTSGIRLTDALAGLIRNSHILDRQIRFCFKDDTDNRCRRSRKDPNHNKQDKTEK